MTLSSGRTTLTDSNRRLLERYLAERPTRQHAPVQRIGRRPLAAIPSLSFSQEQVWRRAIALPEIPSFYNECVTIHRTGHLDVDLLQCSFTEIVRRHEIWRTNFCDSESGPLQIIHTSPDAVPFEVVNLENVRPERRDAEALSLATEHARMPFDLEHGALIRALLISSDKHCHRLFVTMHQSIVDGISAYRILPTELAALYQGYQRGMHSPLTAMELQYADFAYWERKWLKEEVWTAQTAFWRDRLAHFPVMNWPAPRSQSSTQGSRGAIQQFSISPALLQDLRECSQRNGVTLFMTLLAALALLLGRKTEQKSIIIGTVAPAGRKHLEVQSLLGYFLNPVALRFDLSGNGSIEDLLRQCRDATLDALSNDDVPFENLIEEIRPELDARSQSLLPVALTLAPPVEHPNDGWHQTPMDLDTGWAKWGLYLEMSARPEGLLGRAQYSTDLFSSLAVSQLLKDFTNLLIAIVSVPAQEPFSKLLASSVQTPA